MTIALRVLAVDEEALRHDQMEVVLCAGHGDLEQATFLLDLRRGAGTEVGGHAAVDDIELSSQSVPSENSGTAREKILVAIGNLAPHAGNRSLASVHQLRPGAIRPPPRPPGAQGPGADLVLVWDRLKRAARGFTIQQRVDNSAIIMPSPCRLAGWQDRCDQPPLLGR